MNICTMKPNADGQLVTAYAGNPTFGYITLVSTQIVEQNGWLQEKDRTTLLRGKTDMLQRIAAAKPTMQGSIKVTECLEDNIPDALVANFNKNQTREEQIAPFIKRAGENGPVLTLEGKRILRFTSFDPTGSAPDTRVFHDNKQEVVAFNAVKSKAEANLPA